VDQDAVDQDAVDQDAVDQEPVNQEPVDQEPVDQGTLDQEPPVPEPLHQEPVNQETLSEDAALSKTVQEASDLTKHDPEVFPVYIEYLCRGTVNSVTLFHGDDSSRRTTAGIFNAIVFAANHGLSDFQDRLMTAQILTDEPLSIPMWAEHYARVERGNIFRDYVAQVIAYELGVLWGPYKEVDRDEVEKMLTGEKQMNREVLTNGDKPNGCMHLNGDTQQPNGVPHPNGITPPTGNAQLLEDVLDYMKPIPGNTQTHPNIAPVCFYHIHASGAHCPDFLYPLSASLWIM
ncbi:hypothetical protein V492_00945, partial [Pseudogymnoascus sp. VKM F-4246]